MRMSGIVCAVTALLGLACFAYAQERPFARYGQWQSCPIGGGGNLQEIIYCPSDANRMYVLSDVGGLWRSDDAGKSWSMLHGALPGSDASYSPRSMLVNPANADRLILATGTKWTTPSGIWISDDGGHSWSKSVAATFEGDQQTYRHTGDVLARDPRNANCVLAGPLGGGLLLSEDDGATWTRVGPTDIGPTAIVFDRAAAGRVWVCAQAWKSAIANSGAKPLQGGMYCSDDHGRTWVRVGDEAPGEMVQDPVDTGTLYGLFGRKQVMRSRDAGATWERASQGLPPYPPKWDAYADGIYEAIAVGGKQVILGGCGGHFYCLNREADRWDEVRTQAVNEGEWWGRIVPRRSRHFGGLVGYVAVDPHNGQWAFTDWYGLYFSPDAGKIWNLSIDGIEMTVVHTLAQEPNKPESVHVGVADVGYFRSTDSGHHFTRLTKDFDDRVKITATSTDAEVKAASASKGITNNIKSISSSPVKPGRLYATGPNGFDWIANHVFISSDHGTTWRRSKMAGLPDMKTARCNTIVADPSSEKGAWLAVSGPVAPGQGGIYHSEDGGDTWTWASEGMPAETAFFRSMIFSGNAELAVGPDGSLVAISIGKGKLLTSPAGKSWMSVDLPPGTKVNCVVADVHLPGRFYVAMEYGGLWRTDDAGLTWHNVAKDGVWHVSVDMDKPNRVVASTAATPILSEDGGDHWKGLPPGLPFRSIRNVAAVIGGQVYVGSAGNGVFAVPAPRFGDPGESRASHVASLSARPVSGPQ